MNQFLIPQLILPLNLAPECIISCLMPTMKVQFQILSHTRPGYCIQVTDENLKHLEPKQACITLHLTFEHRTG